MYHPARSSINTERRHLSCGTVPTALQRLNYVLPMTYTLQGFRTLISTGDYEILLQDILRLHLSSRFTIAYKIGAKHP